MQYPRTTGRDIAAQSAAPAESSENTLSVPITIQDIPVMRPLFKLEHTDIHPSGAYEAANHTAFRWIVKELDGIAESGTPLEIGFPHPEGQKAFYETIKVLAKRLKGEYQAEYCLILMRFDLTRDLIEGGHTRDDDFGVTSLMQADSILVVVGNPIGEGSYGYDRMFKMDVEETEEDLKAKIHTGLIAVDRYNVRLDGKTAVLAPHASGIPILDTLSDSPKNQT